jgi:hypothetical protein
MIRNRCPGAELLEHAPGPLALVETATAHLRVHGPYLIANNFWPDIKCPLPPTSHFRWRWDIAMNRMNLRPGNPAAYARAHARVGAVSARPTSSVETGSPHRFGLIERTSPRGRPRAVLLRIGGRP